MSLKNIFLLYLLTAACGSAQETHPHGVDSVIAEYIREIESKISLPDSVLVLGMVKIWEPGISDSAVGQAGITLSLYPPASYRLIELTTAEEGVFWYVLSRAEAQQGIWYLDVRFKDEYFDVSQFGSGPIDFWDGITFDGGFSMGKLSPEGGVVKKVEISLSPLQSTRIFLKNNPEGKWSKLMRKLLPVFKAIESLENLPENDYDSMISIFSELLEKMPWSRFVHFYAITSYLEKFVHLMESEQKQEATQAMQDALQTVERLGKQGEWMLCNLSENVFLDEAIEAWTYEYLIGKCAEGRGKYQLLYELYDDWSEHDKRGTLCRQWIQDFPEDREAYIHLLDYYIDHASDSSDVSGALKFFHSALSKDIKFELGQYQSLASICFSGSMFKETCEIYELMPLQIPPSWWEFWYYVQALDSLGDRKKAKKVVSDALQRFQADTSHHITRFTPLIESCLTLGMEQEALSVLQYELERQKYPERSKLRWIVARSYREYNKHESAIKILKEGIAEDSSYTLL